MWVCLRTVKHVVVHGEMKHYQPGDWVNVGGQLARDWIAGGDAYTIETSQLAECVEPTSGLVVRGALPEEWRAHLSQISGLQIAFGEGDWLPELPFTETLIWTPEFDLRLDLLLTGFRLLKVWQVAVPLFDYTTLASQVGTPEEREATRAIIRDLRVPLRDTRLIYARRCDDTRALMTAWREALARCRDERLAFMQALYTVKPLVCDLPASWTGKENR